MVQVDYIIVGQGITGTFLSYFFTRAGKQVLVIDDAKANSASRVASGIINPVTGRRVVETWMIDKLLPFAQSIYEEVGELLGVDLIQEIDLVNFHATEQMKNAWSDRAAQGSDYILPVRDIENLNQFFDTGLGADMVSPTLLIDLSQLLESWRRFLVQKDALVEEEFDINNCVVEQAQVAYKDIKAEKIFFCNGTAAFEYSYFNKLPFSYNKGEALIVEIEGLPSANIYKQGTSIVPMGGNLFWVGSSFEWKFEDDQPTEAFRKKVKQALDGWLKLPYKILDHKAAVRPASMERRPFVGIHPQHPAIGILNGMGTKGCSLAPYFANQLVENVIDGKPIDDEAVIHRFKKILMR